MYVDVGSFRLVVRQWEAGGPVQRAVGRAILRDLDIAETLAQLQDRMEGLTLDIPEVWIEESPMRFQRHTIGMPSHWMRLLHTIA